MRVLDSNVTMKASEEDENAFAHSEAPDWAGNGYVAVAQLNRTQSLSEDNKPIIAAWSQRIGCILV